MTVRTPRNVKRTKTKKLCYLEEIGARWLSSRVRHFSTRSSLKPRNNVIQLVTQKCHKKRDCASCFIKWRRIKWECTCVEINIWFLLFASDRLGQCAWHSHLTLLLDTQNYCHDWTEWEFLKNSRDNRMQIHINKIQQDNYCHDWTEWEFF